MPDIDLAEPATLERVADIAANLDAYIDRRATELAQPLIDAAQADADAKVHTAQMELQRRDDLLDELRRQIKVLARHVDNCPAYPRRLQ